ncbi:MAG: SMC family ATPase, partial [Deinococcota bacterium]|nr:SMC family ATPase [Deinococcota bacterium]
MKPLKLELSGFTCFRDRAVVSFEDLTLFAISGPTGSGKSSLLDAIIFALYGQTPRLGKKGLAALLNPNAEQLHVVFEFEAGDGIYRALRTLRQTRSAVVAQPRIEMQQPDASWKQLPETGIAEINSRLETIVGLDYDSFTRAVLLPQGEFSKFLHGGAEAGALLIKLLGLERIKEMQREAGSRASAAKSRQGFIAAQLEHDLAGATPERLRELKDNRTALGVREGELKALAESVSAQLQEQEKVKALMDDLAAVRGRLEAFRAQEAKITEDKVALRRAHDAALITPQLGILDERRERLKRAQERERSLKEALEAQERALGEAEEALRGAEQEAKRIPDIGAKLEGLAALAPLLGRLRSLGGTVALADRADEGVPYGEEAWQALQGLTLSLPGLRSARRQVDESIQALGKAERAVEATSTETATLKAQLDALTRQGKAARETAEAAVRRYREAEDGNRALALRRHLHAGEACPVCEQVVKRVPAAAGDDADIDALERARDEAAEALDALKTRYRDTKGKLEGAQGRLADREESLK